MIRTLRGLGLVVAALAWGSSPVASQDLDEGHREAILELMQLTESEKMIDQMLTLTVLGMMQALQSARPDIPADAFDTAEGAAITVMVDHQGEFLDAMVEIYARHFTVDEIRELNVFYRSPLGRKVIRKMPETMAEGAAAGRAWAESLEPQVRAAVERELTERGY
jgi:hypothetical protein